MSIINKISTPDCKKHTCKNISTAASVYIHWPWCKSKCPYCDFNSYVISPTLCQKEWREALLTELRYFLHSFNISRIDTVFFGGGTPSLIEPETIYVLLNEMKNHGLSNTAEITLESNPTSVEVKKFESFQKAGINRLSLGVQSLNDASLHFLGRTHSAKEAKKALEITAYCFPRFSFDMIYALPHISLHQWKKELNEALSFHPKHLSLYQLTIEPNTSFFKLGIAPANNKKAAKLYRQTHELTKHHNLLHYEISNYAVAGNESQHNLVYWKGKNYIGIGPAAHGRLPMLNKIPWHIMTYQIKNPYKWLKSVQKYRHGTESCNPLSPHKRNSEKIILGLRLSEGVPISLIQEYGVKTEKIAQLKKENYITYYKKNIALTLEGRLRLDAITYFLLFD